MGQITASRSAGDETHQKVVAALLSGRLIQPLHRGERLGGLLGTRVCTRSARRRRGFSARPVA